MARSLIDWVLFELSVLQMKKLKDGEESLLAIPASRSLNSAPMLSRFGSQSLHPRHPTVLSPHGNCSLGQKDKDCAHELFKHRFEARDVSSGARRDSLRRDVLETACGLQDVISSASASCCCCSFCCCCLFPCLLF